MAPQGRGHRTRALLEQEHRTRAPLGQARRTRALRALGQPVRRTRTQAEQISRPLLEVHQTVWSKRKVHPRQTTALRPRVQARPRQVLPLRLTRRAPEQEQTEQTAENQAAWCQRHEAACPVGREACCQKCEAA